MSLRTVVTFDASLFASNSDNLTVPNQQELAVVSASFHAHLSSYFALLELLYDGLDGELQDYNAFNASSIGVNATVQIVQPPDEPGVGSVMEFGCSACSALVLTNVVVPAASPLESEFR